MQQYVRKFLKHKTQHSHFSCTLLLFTFQVYIFYNWNHRLHDVHLLSFKHDLVSLVLREGFVVRWTWPELKSLFYYFPSVEAEDGNFLQPQTQTIDSKSFNTTCPPTICPVPLLFISWVTLGNLLNLSAA